MSEPRLIRKYVNRRLYDTVESRYVNLEDLRRVINAGGEIRVVDQASGRDITTTDRAVAIVGEVAASILWPDANPLGQTLFVSEGPGAATTMLTVIGVARDMDAKIKAMTAGPRR